MHSTHINAELNVSFIRSDPRPHPNPCCQNLPLNSAQNQSPGYWFFSSVRVVGHRGGSSGSGSLLHSGVQSRGFKHSDGPVSQWPADVWCESEQQTALPGEAAAGRDRKVQPGGEGHCMCCHTGQWSGVHQPPILMLHTVHLNQLEQRILDFMNYFPCLDFPCL